MNWLSFQFQINECCFRKLWRHIVSTELTILFMIDRVYLFIIVIIGFRYDNSCGWSDKWKTLNGRLKVSPWIGDVSDRALRSKLVIKFLSRNLSWNKYLAKIKIPFWRNIFCIYGIFHVLNFAKIQKSVFSTFCRALVSVA